MQIVRDMLAREGIETEVFNEHTASVLGEIPFFCALPELWVLRDDDAEAARIVIKRFESGQARDELPSQPWECPQCGELLGGQFTQCWRCEESDPRGEEDG